MAIVDKRNLETRVFDIAVPGDYRMKGKETEKISKDFSMEVNRMSRPFNGGK